MKLQSRESVTIDILGTARELFWGVVAQVLQLMAFVIVAALAPAILVVLPLCLIWQNPSQHLTWLAQTFFWTAPLSCAFYMVVLCHWHSVRQWRREGRDLGPAGSKWREAHGGMVRTVGKSTGFMLLGLFGSFFCEILFMIAFKYVPFEMFDGAARLKLWFVMFPFAAFAPVLLLLLKRRNDSEQRSVAVGFFQREPSAQKPSAVNKALR